MEGDTVTKYSGTLLKQPSKMGRSADSGNTETVNNLYETDYYVLQGQQTFVLHAVV